MVSSGGAATRLYLLGICVVATAVLFGGAVTVVSADTATIDGHSESHLDTEMPALDQASMQTTGSEIENGSQIAPNLGTTWTINLSADGDARWEITTKFDLRTDNETQAFVDIGQEFQAGDLPALGLETFETANQRVDAETERSMRLSNVDRDSSIFGEDINRTGQLTLAFTWENFAAVSEERLYIDEAVLTADGDRWLRGLSEDHTLVVLAPAGYGVDDATVPPENGALQWTGPVEFDRTSLQATFVGDQARTDGDEDTDGDTAADDDEVSLVPLVLAGVILVVAILSLLVVQRERLRGLVAGDDSDELDDHPEEDIPPADGAAETGDDGVSTDDEVDLALLSDEERIEHLLESNGGRMKQASIVKETDWSNAKVSQLLSAMEEAGQIDKLRIGRENLISFPDEDIGDFDDES